MAVPDDLADLMREDLGALPGLGEQRMFGGLCFLLDGNMICGISKRGAFYRVGKQRQAAALALGGVAPMIHGARRMGGFVMLETGTFRDDPDLRERLCGWAVGHAASLPPKPGPA